MVLKILFINDGFSCLLFQVSLEAQSNGYIYEDVAIDEGNKINADMFIDNRPGQYVYVMTPRKVGYLLAAKNEQSSK